MNKRIITLATIGIIVSIPVMPAISSTCCTYEAAGTSCQRWFCTHNGITTEYTNCATCKTLGTMLEFNGSYEPCGDGEELSSDFGECVIGSIEINQECDAGTYGDANSYEGCIPCPTPGTSMLGATKITDCYIPGNKAMTDTTGTFMYTSNCYYYSDLVIGGEIEPEFPIGGGVEAEPITP